VRIGTLASYRAAELGPAIGDAREGESQTEQFIEQPLDISRPENRSWVLEKVAPFLFPPGSYNIIADRCLFTLQEADADSFIYCMSHRFSGRAMREFRADACVQVDDPRGFIEALVGGLVDRAVVSESIVGPCDYTGRDRNEKMHRISPAFLKDAGYAYQHELRIVMKPVKAGPLEPFLISLPEIRRYCRLRP